MSHGYVFVLLCCIGQDDWYDVRYIYTYRREAFALLVSTNRAMREPRWVGRATSTGSHAFYLKYIYIIVADSRESIGKRNKDL